jgi:AcrR family transcriptional regulator
VSPNPAKLVPDLRVRRTHKLLWEALVTLMSEQDFASISVTNICERAMIHRTTFYKHFEDKCDLLIHSMEELHNSLKQEMLDIERTTPEGNNITRTALVFEHIIKYEHFYRLMLCGDGVGKYHALLRRYLASRFEVQFGHLQQSSGHEISMPVEILAQHRAGSLISVVIWWLENDRPYSSAQMAQYMKECNLFAK